MCGLSRARGRENKHTYWYDLDASEKPWLTELREGNGSAQRQTLPSSDQLGPCVGIWLITTLLPLNPTLSAAGPIFFTEHFDTHATSP